MSQAINYTKEKLEKKIRNEFADTMLEIGKLDENLVVFIGDISHYVLQPFAKACPGKFYNIGICEPTMVNMAAGLSKLGFHPVVHTIAPFIVERSFEQIKLDFGYQKLGVNIITVGGAFDYSSLGPTHHCYADFALLKNVEGSQIIYPASCKEFNLLFKQTYDNNKPTYFRIPEDQHGILFEDKDIQFGKGIILREGKDLTIVVTGPQLKIVLEAAEKLKKENINAEIIYLHTIKPLDIKLILKSLNKTKKCLVIEEHSVYGGTFDDILRSTTNLSNTTYDSINIGDSYVHEYGTYQQHCKRIGFSVENIRSKAKNLLKKK